jgi:carbonic anhydrase/acetyltransferase-like protein (isoleucine patch superfamily)
VGPNLSIGAGSVLDGVQISHSIVGAKAKLKTSVLRNSLIGDDTIVEGVRGEVTLGDNSEVHAS